MARSASDFAIIGILLGQGRGLSAADYRALREKLVTLRAHLST